MYSLIISARVYIYAEPSTHSFIHTERVRTEYVYGYDAQKGWFHAQTHTHARTHTTAFFSPLSCCVQGSDFFGRCTLLVQMSLTHTRAASNLSHKHQTAPKEEKRFRAHVVLLVYFGAGIEPDALFRPICEIFGVFAFYRVCVRSSDRCESMFSAGPIGRGSRGTAVWLTSLYRGRVYRTAPMHAVHT